MAKENAPTSSFNVALAAVNRALGDDAGSDDLDPGDESVADTDDTDLTVDGDDDGADDEDTDSDESADDDDADEAEGDEADGDADEAVDGDDETDDDGDEEVPDAAAVAAAEAAAKAATTDEFDKLLDELGFRAPKKGQRENRIPQSRVRARMKTALKKYAGTRDAGQTEITGKLTAAQARVQQMDNIDALLAGTAEKPEDAKRYIEMLAAIHPAFKPFLEPGQARESVPTEDAAVAAAITKLGAKPGPDVDYKDGTFGYSNEQMEKREQWLESRAAIIAGANATKAVTAAMEARFSPMEREYKTAAQARQDAPRIEARLSSMRSLWGAHFTADEAKGKDGSEILKYQREHKCSFEDATAAVILPKMVADRTKMRQELLLELKGKKKQVAKTAPQAMRRAQKVTGKRTTVDVVHAALARHGL